MLGVWTLLSVTSDIMHNDYSARNNIDRTIAYGPQSTTTICEVTRSEVVNMADKQSTEVDSMVLLQ